jgi:hypothetical protein
MLLIRRLFTSLLISHIYRVSHKFHVIKVNVKANKIKVLLHANEELGERGYSSYSFTTSELDAGEWSETRQGQTLPPGKGTPVLVGKEAGWAPEPVWTQRLEEKSFCPCLGLNPDRPAVVRLYTD